MQAAQRGKPAVSTEADVNDPLKGQYGDAELVQSKAISGKVWTRVDHLTPALADKKVIFLTSLS